MKTQQLCPPLADVLRAGTGELPEPRQAIVWAHIERCPACRAQLAFADATQRACAALADDVEVTVAPAKPLPRWASFAAAALVLIAATVVVRPEVVVQAAELFGQAARHVVRFLGRPASRQPAPSSADNTAAVALAPLDPELLDRAELDARLILRRADLDLGDTVRLSRAPRAVIVAGAIASPSARQQAIARLEAVPYVEVSLRERRPSTESPVIESVGVSRWLDRTLGAGPSRTTFVPELLENVSRVRQRLSAMQTLAQRYTGAEIERLSEDARARLQQLVRLHYDPLARDLTALDLDVRVIIEVPSVCVDARQETGAWRRRAEAGLAAATRFESQVRTLITSDARLTDGPLNRPDISRPYAALWQAVYCPDPSGR